MYESNLEPNAIPVANTRWLRRIRICAIIGVLFSLSMLICGLVAHIQETADQMN